MCIISRGVHFVANYWRMTNKEVETPRTFVTQPNNSMKACLETEVSSRDYPYGFLVINCDFILIDTKRLKHNTRNRRSHVRLHHYVD